MQERLNYAKAAPDAVKALFGLYERSGKSGLEHALVELVRLRASQINGCAYCVDAHGREARKAGEDERRLSTLITWRETPFFTDRERAALAWTEALTLVADTHVPDAVWDEVKPYFTPEELVELTLVVTTINALNRFAIAFRKLPQ